MQTTALLAQVRAAEPAFFEFGKVRLRAGQPVTDALLEELTARTEGVWFEGDEDDHIILSGPSAGRIPEIGSAIGGQCFNWALDQGENIPRGRNGAYHPPGWYAKIPYISWVSREREQLAKRDGRLPVYWQVAPNFVVEIASERDPVAEQIEKMAGWIEHGSLLGLVVDPPNETVYVHRPGRPVETHVSPDGIVCSPELPGLEIDFGLIWRYLADDWP